MKNFIENPIIIFLIASLICIIMLAMHESAWEVAGIFLATCLGLAADKWDKKNNNKQEKTAKKIRKDQQLSNLEVPSSQTSSSNNQRINANEFKSIYSDIYSDHSDYLLEKEKRELEQEKRRLEAEIKQAKKEKDWEHTHPYVPYEVHLLRRPLKDFVAIDTETTGLNVVSDHVIQIGAVKYKNDKKVAEYLQNIKPVNYPIPKFIESLTGIKNADLTEAPDFSEVKEEFVKFCEGLPLIGHNIDQFDLPILQYDGLGQKEYSTEDTLKMARRILYDENIPSNSLPFLKLYFNINNASHNALADSQTTAFVYRYLRDGKLDPQFKQVLKGKHVSLVGSFKWPHRDSVEHFVKLLGGTVRGKVDKDTFCLIAENNNGETQREHNAQELNIPVWNYKTFFEHINALIEND